MCKSGASRGQILDCSASSIALPIPSMLVNYGQRLFANNGSIFVVSLLMLHYLLPSLYKLWLPYKHGGARWRLHLCKTIARCTPKNLSNGRETKWLYFTVITHTVCTWLNLYFRLVKKFVFVLYNTWCWSYCKPWKGKNYRVYLR